MKHVNNYAVEVYTTSGEYVGKWSSVSCAAKHLGIKRCGNIQSCLCGMRNNACGYVWKYSSMEVPLLPGEEWKPVIGFESLYAVSDKGRVASIQYHGKPTFSIMSILNIKGYPAVKIRNSKTGFSKVLKVHRLVAEAFIPNPENKPSIDHIDTDPTNNCVENLKWVTALENQRNPLTLAKISAHMRKMNAAKIGPIARSKKYSIPVKHNDGNTEILYQSAKEAGTKTGHTTSVILRWCRAGKYGWSIVNL